MFCSNCGTQLREGAKFCPNCGNVVKKKSNKKDVSSIFKQIKPVYAIAVLAIVVIFFIGRALFGVIGNSEADKCKEAFYVAMNELKIGDIDTLKQYMAGENIGAIEELLQAFNISDEATAKVMRVLFMSVNFDVVDVIKEDTDRYILKTEVSLPDSEFWYEFQQNFWRKVELTDIGVIFGRESKINKMIDKLIEAYNEVDIGQHGWSLLNYDIEVVKYGDRYVINNFSDFLDNSSIGQFVTAIRPILQLINSFLN